MANTKFIRLHNAENNTVVIINIEHIVVIDTNEIGNRTVSIVYLDERAGIQEFNINETPEKIFTMIEEMDKQNK